MTNAMIIMIETQKLAEAGVLRYTGRMIPGINIISGEPVEIPKIEPIHTYKGWNERGYKVKKGATAEIKFPIYHYTYKKKKTETEEKAQERGHCYMRMASWFRFDQVEPK